MVLEWSSISARKVSWLLQTIYYAILSNPTCIGRALGEVTKYLVYNARKRGSDRRCLT